MRPTVFRGDGSGADPVQGRAAWAPVKSFWINVCLLGFVVGAPFATSLSAVFLFLVSTYLSLLLGHSIGMHRKLIHRTYECAKSLERFLVYSGVIVGMAFIGLLLGGLWRIAGPRPHTDGLMFLLYLTICFGMLDMPEAGSVVVGIVYRVLVIGLLVWVTRYAEAILLRKSEARRVPAG